MTNRLFFREYRLSHNLDIDGVWQLDRRCSKGSYLTYKPVCLGKSLNMMDFPAITDKFSFLGINQLNTRKIHPPA